MAYYYQPRDNMSPHCQCQGPSNQLTTVCNRPNSDFYLQNGCKFHSTYNMEKETTPYNFRFAPLCHHMPSTAPPTGSFPVPQIKPQGAYSMTSQQPMGFGITTGNPQAYTYPQQAPMNKPPKSYLGYSIFVTICCCWICGIVAIVRACESRMASRTGNFPEAAVKSGQAKKFSHIALAFGILTFVVIGVVMGVVNGYVIPNASPQLPKF